MEKELQLSIQEKQADACIKNFNPKNQLWKNVQWFNLQIQPSYISIISRIKAAWRRIAINLDVISATTWFCMVFRGKRFVHNRVAQIFCINLLFVSTEVKILNKMVLTIPDSKLYMAAFSRNRVLEFHRKWSILDDSYVVPFFCYCFSESYELRHPPCRN